MVHKIFTLADKLCNSSLTSRLDRLLHEVCDLVEVHGDVGLGHVGQLEPLVLDAERLVELLGVNSIDIMNFGHETGRETGPSSGPNSVLGHNKFRHVSKYSGPTKNFY